MDYADLAVDGNTQKVLGKLRFDNIRGFRGSAIEDHATTYGFYCTTHPQHVQEIPGVDPIRVHGSILRKVVPITVRVTYGIKQFDHSIGARGGPVWKPFPLFSSATDQQAQQAALIYGDAVHGLMQFALRMYWGEPGQGADDLRTELLALLASNE